MKFNRNDFLINFVGLKLGKHHFEFEIDETFFSEFEYSLIETGNLKGKLELEKKETMMIGNYSIKGEINHACDRCNVDFKFPIQGDLRLIYKFGDEDEVDETLVILHPEDYQINTVDALYELINLSLPNRIVHPEGECDEEMVEMLSKYVVNINEEDDFDGEDDNDDEDDDVWEILKNLN